MITAISAPEEEHIPILKCIVGSHNYNLNTADSDRDYKIFVLPTFDDLYYGKRYNKQITNPLTDDVSYYDIRNLSDLLWKANINFLEVLFSIDMELSDDLYIREYLNAVLNMKDDIAKMNLPYLYNACIGMFHNKYKALEKGTESTQCLVDKFGYDTKQALHCLRCLYVIEDFLKNEFTDFKAAITYDNDQAEYLLGIKEGKYSLGVFKYMAEGMFNFVEKTYKPIYQHQEINQEIKDILDSIIKDIIQYHITNI